MSITTPPPRRTSPPPAPGRAPTLLDSFNYAFEGIIHVLRTQRNLRIHFAIAIARDRRGGRARRRPARADLAAARDRVRARREMVNSAIEGAIDVSTTSFDPNAKLAKDIAAGAVLISTVTALAVGYLVFAHAAAHRTRALPRPRPRRAGGDHARRARARDPDRDRDQGVDGQRHTAARRPSFGSRGGRLRRLDGGDLRHDDQHRFLISSLTFIMALLVAQTRVESGVHSALEVLYGGALGALVTLGVFQLLS